MALPSAAQLLATDPLLLLSAPVDPGQRIALSLPGVPFASDWSGLLGPALRVAPALGKCTIRQPESAPP